DVATELLEGQHGQLEELAFGDTAQVAPDIHRAQQADSRELRAHLGADGMDLRVNALEQLWIDGELSGLTGSTHRLAEGILELGVRYQCADRAVSVHVTLGDIPTQSDAYLLAHQYDVALARTDFRNGLEHIP